MADLDSRITSQPTKVGSITIELFLSGDGTNIGYRYDGMTSDAAIGYMTVVLDRMREERKYEWATCPECRQPWSAHDGIYEDDLDDTDEDVD